MLLLHGGIYLTDLYQNCCGMISMHLLLGNLLIFIMNLKKTHSSVGVGNCGNKRLKE